MNQISMPFFSEIIKANLSNVETILEIGSLNGLDCLYLKNEFPLARAIAVEGLNENYELYMKNLSDIESYNIIISSFDGFIDYHKKNVNGIHGIYDRGQEFGTFILNQMPTKTLDTFCEEIKLKKIDVLKIDVEGATYDILSSSNKMLNAIKIMYIETESCEFFKGQKLDNEVMEFLEKNNFVLLKKTSCSIESGFQYDSVWINKEYLYN